MISKENIKEWIKEIDENCGYSINDKQQLEILKLALKGIEITDDPSDTMRLDWLIAEYFYYRLGDEKKDYRIEQKLIGWGETPRDAIDFAMKAGKNG